MRTTISLGAAVILLAAAAASAQRQDPIHGFLTAADGVRIHYADMGRGTPVVLIHGYTANAEGKWFKWVSPRRWRGNEPRRGDRRARARTEREAERLGRCRGLGR